MTFIYCVLFFILGGTFVFLLVKKVPLPKVKNQNEKGLNELLLNNNLLGIDKVNLQNRNNNLVKIIDENQQSIKKLSKNDKELREDVKIIISHQITILELLSNVTKIRDHGDLNAQVVVTKRFAKKYFLDSNKALSKIDNSEIYNSD